MDLMSIVGDVMYALLIQQGNDIFMARKHSCLIKKQQKWSRFEHKGLKATDFVNMTNRDATNQHPDFKNVKQMKFGVVSMNSTTAQKSQTISGLDNLRVVFHCEHSTHKTEKIASLKLKLKEQEATNQNLQLTMEILKKKFAQIELDLQQYQQKMLDLQELKDLDVVPVMFDPHEDLKKPVPNKMLQSTAIALSSAKKYIIDDYMSKVPSTLLKFC